MNNTPIVILYFAPHLYLQNSRVVKSRPPILAMLVGFHINLMQEFLNFDEYKYLKTDILETACCT